jgi:hypothetical protein
MPYLEKDPAPDHTTPSNGLPLSSPNINHGMSDHDFSEEEERLNTQPEEVILQGGSKRKGAIIDKLEPLEITGPSKDKQTGTRLKLS